MKGYGNVDFADEDFGKLHLKVHGLPNHGNAIAQFPVLRMFPEFRRVNDQPGINGLQLVKYIVYLYDSASPLREKISDIRLRKVHAMDLVGIPIPESGSYSEEINHILGNHNEEVLRMIFRYCRWHRGARYAYFVSLQEGVYNTEEKIAQGDLGRIDSMRKATQEMERVADDLLGGDGIGRIVENFLDYVEMETLGISPEEIALALHNNEDPLPGVDPYGLAAAGKSKEERLTAIAKRHAEKVRARYGGQ